MFVLKKSSQFKKKSNTSASNQLAKNLDYLYHNANFCVTIPFQKKSVLTTPNVKNKFWSSYETLEDLKVPVKWKW